MRPKPGDFPRARPASLSLLEAWIPAEAEGVGRFVVFALDHELRAALIETENLIRQVQAVGDEMQPVRQPDATLDIQLQMGVKVLIAERSVQPPGRWFRRSAVGRRSPVLIGVGRDVSL